MIDFPFSEGDKSFCCTKIKVEYMNSDEVTIVSDQSWLTIEQYNNTIFTCRFKRIGKTGNYIR